jgi:hypothetical protein
VALRAVATGGDPMDLDLAVDVLLFATGAA